MTHGMLLDRIVRNGRLISPLLEAPWVTVDIFRPDWLHAADLGVSPLFLGNLFWFAIHSRDPFYLEGDNQQTRCSFLWRWIQQFYDDNDVQDRLGSFGLRKVRADKKGPCLGGTAACVRALIPFGKILAEHILSVRRNPITEALCAAATSLHHCYESLSSEQLFAQALMKESGQNFCLQYGAVNLALATKKNKLWKIKPKFHIFLHMIEDGSLPALYWAFRDESFGGSVARMARRRAGPKTPLSMSTRVLDSFRIREDVPRMRVEKTKRPANIIDIKKTSLCLLFL